MLFRSHLRSESNAMLDAVAETMLIAKKTGVRAQVAHHKASGKHNWGKLIASLRMIDETRQSGYDVGVDMPEDVCVEKETTGDLGEALLHIPTKQRKRLLMHSVAGLTINEIARAEKCSERSIEYSLSLARKNLREILGEGYTPK